MGKLNQVIAVVAAKKKHATAVLTEAYHKIQKGDLLSGISRRYQPKDEDGDQLPSESKHVQCRVNDVVDTVSAPLADMWDCVCTQDVANTQAKTDVIVDGIILASDVPVTHLLFLEKQLTDLSTFVSKLPTLDPADQWHWDDNANCYATEPIKSVRTKKVPKTFVKYEATKEHPAQVEVFHEDVLVGTWDTIKFCGDITATDKAAMLDRVRDLKEAVVKAREEANGMEVTQCRNSRKLIDFIFKGE